MIQNIFLPIEDIALDMKRNVKTPAYSDKLSKVMQSIQERLNHNKSNPRSLSALASMIEDSGYDPDEYYDDDLCDPAASPSGPYADPDAEVEVVVPIKGPMSKRTSMVVTTPRSMVRSMILNSPRKEKRGGTAGVGLGIGLGIGGEDEKVEEQSEEEREKVKAEREEEETMRTNYGEFPEIRFLRPAGMDPGKMGEFAMSIKDMIEEDDL